MKRREMLAGYLFLLPAALCLLVWTIYPIINSFWYSLTDNDILNEARFVGLQNYADLFHDKNWTAALGGPSGMCSCLFRPSI